MPNQSMLLPEEVLVAVLHKVGRNVRIVDDQRLAAIFDEAARSSSTLAPFKRHPQYHYSKRLSNTLQVLDLGGSIVRENAPTKFFSISAHTAGPYGESRFGALPQEAQGEVDKLAKKIREVFGA